MVKPCETLTNNFGFVLLGRQENAAFSFVFCIVIYSSLYICRWFGSFGLLGLFGSFGLFDIETLDKH